MCLERPAAPAGVAERLRGGGKDPATAATSPSPPTPPPRDLARWTPSRAPRSSPPTAAATTPASDPASRPTTARPQGRRPMILKTSACRTPYDLQRESRGILSIPDEVKAKYPILGCRRARRPGRARPRVRQDATAAAAALVGESGRVTGVGDDDAQLTPRRSTRSRTNVETLGYNGRTWSSRRARSRTSAVSGLGTRAWTIISNCVVNLAGQACSCWRLGGYRRGGGEFHFPTSLRSQAPGGDQVALGVAGRVLRGNVRRGLQAAVCGDRGLRDPRVLEGTRLR